MNVAFWRIAGRDIFVVHIAVVGPAVAVNRDRRIGPLDLRLSARDYKLVPRRPCISTRHAPLFAVAMIDRQPDSSVGRDVQMAVQATTTLSAGTRISRHAGTPSHAEIDTPLAKCRTDNVLRAIQCVFTLIGRRN